MSRDKTPHSGNIASEQSTYNDTQNVSDEEQAHLSNTRPIVAGSASPHEPINAHVEARQEDGAEANRSGSVLDERIGGKLPDDRASVSKNFHAQQEPEIEVDQLHLTDSEAASVSSERDYSLPPMPLTRHGFPVYVKSSEVYLPVIKQIAHDLRRKGMMFNLGGQLCSVQQVRQHSKVDGRALTHPKPVGVNRQGVAASVEEIARFAVFRPITGRWEFVRHVRDFYETILSQRQSLFETIEGVVGHPVLYNGDMISGHIGYHRRTRLWIGGDPMAMEQFDDTAEAVRFLQSWLEPFPFATPDDMIRALLLPATLLLSKTTIRGCMPMWLFTSKDSNVGKSYLMNVLSAAITGDHPAQQAWHQDSRELRKSLVSALLEQPPLIFWDNINTGTTFHDPSLCSYATASGDYADRLLGRNTNASLRPTAPLVFTGISIRPVRDTASRTLTVELEAPDRPHPHLEEVLDSTIRTRGKILGALQRILNVSAGKLVHSRFPKWTETVADPVATAFASTTILDCLAAGQSATGGPDFDELVTEMANHPEAVVDRNCEPGERTGFTAGEMIKLFPGPLQTLLVRPGDSELKSQTLPDRLKHLVDTRSGGFWFRRNDDAKSQHRERAIRFYIERRE